MNQYDIELNYSVTISMQAVTFEVTKIKNWHELPLQLPNKNLFTGASGQRPQIQ
jgi:hypothetical protein